MDEKWVTQSARAADKIAEQRAGSKDRRRATKPLAGRRKKGKTSARGGSGSVTLGAR